MKTLPLLLSLMISVVVVTTSASAVPFFHEGKAPASQVGAEADTVTLPNFSRLVRGLSQSVVNVAAEGGSEEEGAEGRKQPGTPDEDAPFRSVGSGFIVNEEGYIATNYHVVGNAERAVVRLLDDKNEYKAVVVGRDQKTDLALLKIEPKKKLSVAVIGDSDSLEVGEWVVAIGNQFQLGQTVTAGIVSAKSRKVPVRSGPYESFIQTDASINPGSSGGPLFNTRGEVVGITSAIFSPGRAQLGGSGFNIGIGFAIPINLARAILSQLREKGRVTRGLLGVMIQPIDADVKEALDLQSLDGALVSDILPETPAGRAGFQRRDVIVAYDGHPVRDFDDLPLLVAATPIGSTVRVDIIRGRRTQSLTVTIEELKEPTAAVQAQKPTANEIGIYPQELSAELARTLGLGPVRGVLVAGVEPNSVAAKAGLARGDIIEEIDGVKTLDIAIFERIIRALPSGKPALFAIRRKDASRLIVLKRR